MAIRRLRGSRFRRGGNGARHHRSRAALYMCSMDVGSWPASLPLYLTGGHGCCCGCCKSAAAHSLRGWMSLHPIRRRVRSRVVILLADVKSGLSLAHLCVALYILSDNRRSAVTPRRAVPIKLGLQVFIVVVWLIGRCRNKARHRWPTLRDWSDLWLAHDQVSVRRESGKHRDIVDRKCGGRALSDRIVARSQRRRRCWSFLAVRFRRRRRCRPSRRSPEFRRSSTSTASGASAETLHAVSRHETAAAAEAGAGGIDILDVRRVVWRRRQRCDRDSDSALTTRTTFGCRQLPIGSSRLPVLPTRLAASKSINQSINQSNFYSGLLATDSARTTESKWLRRGHWFLCHKSTRTWRCVMYTI